MNTPFLTVHCSNLIEESKRSLCLPWAFFRDCQALFRKVFVCLENDTTLLPGLKGCCNFGHGLENGDDSDKNIN